ncbi:protein phosphatase 2C 3-like [Bidens hawaiensis]|uniref:protein phosphatase 2C 3-like n=1 Tax=Bidens hawaiensis TaxID=980011 RepID=UPI00404AAA9E
MAEICCGVVSANDTNANDATPACELALQHRQANSKAARRKHMNLRRVNFVAGVPATALETDNGAKQARLLVTPSKMSCNGFISKEEDEGGVKHKPLVDAILRPVGSTVLVNGEALPKFGVASVCGRRRDMEDAVAIYPSFLSNHDNNQTSSLHYFGVYDGHGCSHVATRCKDRLHVLVKEELNQKLELTEWTKTMERSFNRMDKEVTDLNKGTFGGNCRCELQAPDSDAVGSTAVVAITTPDKIIVANCGDSRAVLCRNGKAVPLSSDHKPDRPDELNRIQAAGGRVIYWEGARVLGVLAMSRAIGEI